MDPVLRPAIGESRLKIRMQEFVPQRVAEQGVADPSVLAPEGPGHGAHVSAGIGVGLLGGKFAVEQVGPELQQVAGWSRFIVNDVDDGWRLA